MFNILVLAFSAISAVMTSNRNPLGGREDVGAKEIAFTLIYRKCDFSIRIRTGCGYLDMSIIRLVSLARNHFLCFHLFSIDK